MIKASSAVRIYLRIAILQKSVNVLGFAVFLKRFVKRILLKAWKTVDSPKTVSKDTTYIFTQSIHCDALNYENFAKKLPGSWKNALF